MSQIKDATLSLPHGLLDEIGNEAETNRRIDTMRTGTGTSERGMPEKRSDILPYMGVYVLRDSWKLGDETMFVRNLRDRTQDSIEHNHTLFKNGLALFTSTSVWTGQKATQYFSWEN